MDNSHNSNINLNEFLKQNTEGDILLIFTAAWLSQSSIVDIVSQKIQLALPELKVKLLDVEHNEDLISRFYIQKLPSAVIIKKGLIKGKITGTLLKKNVIDAYHSE